MSTSSQIFRDEAIKQYKKKRDKVTLPRFRALPTTLLIWILFGIAMVVGCVAWNDEMPIYATAPGIVLNQSGPAATNQSGAEAALFFPASQLPQLRVGQQAMVNIGASKQQLASKVIKIDPTVVSPDVIHQRYGFMAQVVTQPSIVVLVQINDMPAATFAGTVLVANVKTGSQRILSMLPGLGSLMRG